MLPRCAVVVALSAFVFALGLPLDGEAQSAALRSAVTEITTDSPETPDGAGLLSVAMAEVQVVRSHVQLSLVENDLSSLDEIQLHNRHAIHALDPELEPDGPGPGYGLIRALEGIAERAGRVAESEEGSDAVRRSAGNVESLATKAAEDARSLLDGTRVIDRAADTAEVRALVPQMLSAAQQLVADVEALEEAVGELAAATGVA